MVARSRYRIVATHILTIPFIGPSRVYFDPFVHVFIISHRTKHTFIFLHIFIYLFVFIYVLKIKYNSYLGQLHAQYYMNKYKYINMNVWQDEKYVEFYVKLRINVTKDENMLRNCTVHAVC